MNQKGQEFGEILLQWHKTIDRDLPWTRTKDPYSIWLSEVILQQTRVAQGRVYYEKMLRLFPSVKDLAAASEDEVMAAWKGLGYYTRARNLHASAKMIVADYNGVFPSSYEDILSLKGIGSYSAAAIGSFAFGLPYAVVDGNVYRVLSRVNGIETPIDTTEGKDLFARTAQDLLNKDQPGDYNQAIMDFGAIVCKPITPLCDRCPMTSLCTALSKDLVLQLPQRIKKIKTTKRYFKYLIIEKENKVFLQKRKAKDIWQGLYEPLIIETGPAISKQEIVAQINEKYKLQLTTTMLHPGVSLKQKLTHQLIDGRFYQLKKSIDVSLEGIWIGLDKLETIGTPKIVDQFLKGITHIGHQGELF